MSIATSNSANVAVLAWNVNRFTHRREETAMRTAFRVLTWATGVLVMAAGACPAAAELVTVEYTAYIATVGGNPFGLDASARLAPVRGSFTYDTSTPDTLPADPQRGDYPHSAGGAFTAEFLGLVITGSPTPFVQIEDFTLGTFKTDVFRYFDGGSGRVMSLGGVPNPNVGLFIAFVDSSGNAFASDALPETFAFGQPPLAGPPVSFPHTFSLSDSGGTLLLQLDSLTQQVAVIPEPASALLLLAAAVVLAAGRQVARRIRLSKMSTRLDGRLSLP